MDHESFATRAAFIHLVRSGHSIEEAVEKVGRSRAWGYKWWRRFQEGQDWEALQDRSRRPHHPRRLPEEVYRAIRQARSELEAEAHQGKGLGYIGSHAIQARLRQQGLSPLPSISTIERELRRAGMTRPKRKGQTPSIHYPHLRPTRPHQLIQADILPRYLTGGLAVACFNAIDVVSRYPSGRQYERRTAQNAVDFLLAVWQEQGLPEYQQVDNESCFSGGYRHPGVLGKVIRLALFLGVQLVFSPYYHPESNGTVERFHQDYARFVWEGTHLPDLEGVRERSARFFYLYRSSHHHSHLQGRSPQEVHQESLPPRTIPPDFRLPDPLPLTAGQVHFIRAVDEHRQVKVLNMQWDVPKAEPHQGVWVTLNLSPQGATLSVFDKAPGVPGRRCLVKHPFPLKEKVIPLAPEFRPRPKQPTAVRRGLTALATLAAVVGSLVLRPPARLRSFEG